jgi:hypothetical protein
MMDAPDGPIRIVDDVEWTGVAATRPGGASTESDPAAVILTCAG